MVHFASNYKISYILFNHAIVKNNRKIPRIKGDDSRDGEGWFPKKKKRNRSFKNLPTGFKRQHGAVVRLVVLSCLAGSGHVFRHDDAVPDRGNLPAAGACSRAGTEHTIHHARWRANAETTVLTSPLFFFFGMRL